ncbi:hypothetical protein [Pseudomonas sp. 2FG]|uniref:hypothetical protein n=1 Tax=Pseudomonas sp. 2FG TaxID=2502191 RepID=UPI0010F9F846|nr:hypothetical protein [Pseudomonas sp. 2FG]
MNVEIEEVQGTAGWVVKLDTCTVSFRSQDEAEAYAERLQARLDAPHALPASCSEVLTELSLSGSTAQATLESHQ